LVTVPAPAVQEKTEPRPQPEPPGRDLFIPYIPSRTVSGEVRAREFDNVSQVRILAEINKLTVELVKRRSDPNIARADTARLVKRLKELAKQLHPE
jgi:hypothetical protein